MRTSTQILLPLLSLLTSALADPTPHAACLRLRAEDLAASASCGTSSFIAQNLRILPDTLSIADVESVFLAAGCSAAEAAHEQMVALDRCSPAGDLRRRAVSDAIAPMTIGLPHETALLLARQTDAPAFTKLTCSTTRTESTSTCTMVRSGANAGQETCTPTIALFAKCADGLICSPDKESCMVAKTTLDTGGIIVSIGFAVALAISIGLVTFMCCRERAMHKRLAAKAEAAALAKEAAAASKKSKGPDTQPLMTGSPGGPRSQSPASPGGFGAETGGNPFNDGNRL